MRKEAQGRGKDNSTQVGTSISPGGWMVGAGVGRKE
jgi:hypothetical protein